jgi:prepilin-type N-terminal cleavage/methylation domain-containing protein
MKRNGFTLVEMLIAIVVLCTIMVIVVPMRGVRAKKFGTGTCESTAYDD